MYPPHNHLSAVKENTRGPGESVTEAKAWSGWPRGFLQEIGVKPERWEGGWTEENISSGCRKAGGGDRAGSEELKGSKC